MVGAIDAVCDVAQRIIGKLKEGTSGEGPPLLGSAVNHNAGGRPPTPAMKRFADSVARQKGIKPPAGYTKSGSICRTFLDRHAPKKVGDESSRETGSKPPSQAQALFAEKITLNLAARLQGESRQRHRIPRDYGQRAGGQCDARRADDSSRDCQGERLPGNGSATPNCPAPDRAAVNQPL